MAIVRNGGGGDEEEEEIVEEREAVGSFPTSEETTRTTTSTATAEPISKEGGQTAEESQPIPSRGDYGVQKESSVEKTKTEKDLSEETFEEPDFEEPVEERSTPVTYTEEEKETKTGLEDEEFKTITFDEPVEERMTPVDYEEEKQSTSVAKQRDAETTKKETEQVKGRVSQRETPEPQSPGDELSRINEPLNLDLSAGSRNLEERQAYGSFPVDETPGREIGEREAYGSFPLGEGLERGRGGAAKGVRPGAARSLGLNFGKGVVDFLSSLLPGVEAQGMTQEQERKLQSAKEAPSTVASIHQGLKARFPEAPITEQAIRAGLNQLDLSSAERRALELKITNSNNKNFNLAENLEREMNIPLSDVLLGSERYQQQVTENLDRNSREVFERMRDRATRRGKDIYSKLKSYGYSSSKAEEIYNKSFTKLSNGLEPLEAVKFVQTPSRQDINKENVDAWLAFQGISENERNSLIKAARLQSQGETQRAYDIAGQIKSLPGDSKWDVIARLSEKI